MIENELKIVLKGPVWSSPGPGPFFGWTEDWSGPRNSQNQLTAKNLSELVCGGPGLNVLKSGLSSQKTPNIL